MISLPEFRKLLGATAADLTDEEIERIRAIEYVIADTIFESWLRKRNASPQEVLENSITNVYNE